MRLRVGRQRDCDMGGSRFTLSDVGWLLLVGALLPLVIILLGLPIVGVVRLLFVHG